jgi:hypothetical protein
LLVGDVVGQKRAQNLVVDAGEELLDVALQHVAPATGKLLRPVHRAMGAFSYATGVRVIDETTLKDGLDGAAQGVVHHPITKGSGGDETALALLDIRVVVRAGAEGLAA